MRILMIATGYLPYLFSENLCNAKLVYALQEAGIEVDVISKVDEGPAYENGWKEPWLPLKKNSYEIHYPAGSKLYRALDAGYSGLKMYRYFDAGVRWARRAYEKSLALMAEKHYDAVLTRSPTDISHIVGMKLKENTGIKWIANWNDPADPIWPVPYKHSYINRVQQRKEQMTARLLSMADIITFPSETLREHFSVFFPSLETKHTEVIPHIGLSEQLFKRKPPQKSDVLRMCHSGNLSKERNPELTFIAMREFINDGLGQFRLDIMGHTNSYTEMLIDKYQLQQHVQLIGSYPYMEAIDKMQDYDVLVLLEAQLEKGIFFASKFTDYAQTGRPIFAISPKNGFASQMIGRFGSGICVDNTNAQDIKNGLKKLITLWAENNLGKYASNELYKQFSSDVVVKKYMQII